MFDGMNLAIFGIYGIIAIFFVSFAVMEARKRRENIKKLEADLKNKIKNKFELSSKDITLIGQAYGLSPSNSRLALYRVYRDIEDKEVFDSLNKLVAEIQENEPFDTMPDEVKPSLSRLQVLTSKSDVESDKHLLTPITNILTKYQQLLEDKKKTQKKSNIAYTLTIASSLVGVIGLYFAFVSPSAQDIAKELNDISEQELHNKQINAD
ncbi:hypothetical protein [Pseudoalteromonas peptidolytica]|uniref:hypothetical protein n=1 Tax=Pseudoalteromonas peptidolytica TaxID=61150 RepID=UPI00298DF0C0|nr:hypothetical protein [Pseudoalteromonas peptidolytica]MDW7547653.1 hypothetical protein [Pseudoalteromonas peptidolytica]